LNGGQWLFEDELAQKLDTTTQQQYQQMADAYDKQHWNGERDSWQGALIDQVWQPITTDHRQCTKRQCSYFKACCYFQARREAFEADLIVANHDLVLADLSLGGGALLPAPSESIYIFDEAHHLPDKALSHFNYHVRLKATKQWLEQVPRLLSHLVQLLTKAQTLQKQAEKAPELVKQIDENLVFAAEIVNETVAQMPQTDDGQWRFSQGVVPSELRVIANNLALQYNRINALLEDIAELLMEMAKQDAEYRLLVEQQYPQLALFQGRCGAAQMLWQSYAQEVDMTAPPTARWIRQVEGSGRQLDFELWSCPVMVNDLLTEMLWSTCFGAVLTSATLTGGDQFERFKGRAGLPQTARYKVVPSPFNYQERATFAVPAGAADPKDSVRFHQLLAEQLNQLIAPHEATLVIFTSRQQMRDAVAGLNASLRQLVMLQDDFSKQLLVKRHCERVDAGEGSVIFGLTSMTEGIDLPGAYVNHVIIAKLPFSVPSDPVEATLNEWLKGLGRNPFWEISVPDATMRLKQACGRLLRSEQDSGRITLLDRRILTQRYGKTMLDALPDYRRLLS